MPLPFGTIQVNQAAPTTQGSVNPITSQTLAIFGPFPKGPAGWTVVDPSQAITVFGAQNTALNYAGPPTLAEAVGQNTGNRSYSLRLIVGRTHVVNSSGSLTDGASHAVVGITGAGPWAGSPGNALSVTTTAPQIATQRVQYGNGSQNEVQQITFYATTGASGTFTLTGVKSSGSSQTTASITFSATPATLQAAVLSALTNVSTGLGAASVAVAIAPGTPPVPGSIVLNVTFSGTGYANLPQTLIVPGTISLTGGTGTIPVQSVITTNTLTSTVLQTINISSINVLTTAQGVVDAINLANQGPSGIIAATLTSNTYMVTAQAVTLSGGSDGAGGTVANDSNSTIAPLLAQLASGNFGQVDFICAAFDAATVSALVQACVTSGLNNNIFMKPVLGPASGTPKATMQGAYQNANNDRFTFIAPDRIPSSASNGGMIPGYALAAGVAGLKAITSAEYNLYNQPLGGVGAYQITDSSTGTAYTPTDYAALNTAGMATLQYDGQQNRVVIGNLITTAPATNPDGTQNPFLYLSVRHCWDMIAVQIVQSLKGFIGTPSTSTTSMQATGQAIVNSILASTKGRYHNGAQASVIFDPTQNQMTFNIYYGPRIPLGSIVINLGVLVGYSN